LPKTGTGSLEKPAPFNPQTKSNEKIIPFLSVIVFIQCNIGCTVKHTIDKSDQRWNQKLSYFS
jgi:hypothetical protein